MNDENDPATQSWHLDKRVPIALIITILFQTFIAGAAFATFNQRLTAVEAYVATSPTYRERFIRVEAEVPAIRQRLDSIDSHLDRIDDRGARRE